MILEMRAAGGRLQGLGSGGLGLSLEYVPGILWHVQSQEITFLCNVGSFGIILRRGKSYSQLADSRLGP